MTEAEPDFPPMPVIEDLIRGGVAPELVAKVATAFAEIAKDAAVGCIVKELVEMSERLDLFTWRLDGIEGRLIELEMDEDDEDEEAMQ